MSAAKHRDPPRRRPRAAAAVRVFAALAFAGATFHFVRSDRREDAILPVLLATILARVLVIDVAERLEGAPRKATPSTDGG